MSEEPSQRRVSIGEIWPRIQGANRSLAYVIGLSVVLQGFAFLAPLQMQLVVDRAITGGDLQLLDIVAIGFGGLILVQALTEFIRSRLQLLLTQSLSFQVTVDTVNHLLHLPLSYFEKSTAGDLLSRVGSARSAQDTVTRLALSVFLDGLMAAFSLAIMLAYSLRLTVIVIGVLALLTLVQWLMFPIQRALTKEELEARAAEQTHLMESLRSMQAVRSYGLEERRLSAWRGSLESAVRTSIHNSNILAGLGLVRTVLNGLQGVVIIYLGAKIVIYGGGMTLGMLIAYLAYRSMFVDRVTSLLGQLNQFRFIGLHLERSSDILAREGELPREAIGHAPAPAPEGDIELVEVSYSYGAEEVLHSVNLSVPDGAFVAIAGPSGGGKSTLVKIILGLYEPSSGELRVGGRPLSPQAIRSWRRQIGVVTQDDRLFSGSLEENIALFDPDPEFSRLREAAMLACVHDEIENVLGGYGRRVGEIGGQISSGQRQRILLARALYRNPRVLILDEGTANLDVENEKKISRIIEGLSLTRIVVAHQSAMLDSAHVVHVLRNGRLEDTRHTTPA